MENYGPGTLCVHAGAKLDNKVGGVNTPIHVSSSFLYPNPDDDVEAIYPRNMNIPTQLAPAEKIAALEGAESGIVVSSGLAAVSSTILGVLGPGDHAVFQRDLYGGTYNFILSEMRRLGIEFTLVDSTEAESIAAAIRHDTRMLYLESPTNPLVKVMDLQAIAEAAKLVNPYLLAVIDNTFATPILQRPLDLGFDISLHSGTKYLSGHSDLNCGAIASSAETMDRIKTTAINLGVTLNVLDCYILERSLKTLALRMARHSENGMAVASFLHNHPKVKSIYYPGLPDDPGHETASRQMSAFGGMLSFELDADMTTTQAVVSRLNIIKQAISLGGVESLICFPAMTSHANMSPEDREALGVVDNLLRLSVGVEDPEDIIADLEQAIG